MRCQFRATITGVLISLAVLASGQDVPKKKADYRPSSGELATLRERNAALTAKLQAMESRANSALFADAAVFAKAVDYVTRFPDRFYRRECHAEALAAIADGLARATELEKNTASWTTARGAVNRGFRSAVDGSIQPYCVWAPKDYDPQKPMRLDVILHGRNATLNEVSFLATGRSGRIIGTETGRKGEPDCLKLYVFGRGNTSSLWAGEADVYEALASVRARYNVDPDRIVIRGFSMGGTSAWQLGLHEPSRWAAVEVGAGYVQTRPEVLKDIREPWQIAALPIHDAANCAINLTNIPFVSYAGSLDPQREQHLLVQRKLVSEGYVLDRLTRARFLVGEGVGHTMKPETKSVIDAFFASSLPRRVADDFRFIACTPRYGHFAGFHLDSLENLYQRAELRGTRDRVETRNVWVLTLDAPSTLTIDGQSVTGNAFHKRDGRWQAGTPQGLRKRAGLQGPIDDAFQDSFLCVPPVNASDPVLEEFRVNFARYLHGSVRVKAVDEVSASDIAGSNLVLFGDPATNALIARVLPHLPLKWTADTIVLAGRAFSAATNTVALIFPNPLNPDRYVVLNTGHTFPLEAFDDTHWLLYPRLGDYAVLDKKTRTIQFAGLFDRNWQIPAK